MGPDCLVYERWLIFKSVFFRFGHSLVSDIFEGKNQPWKLGKFFGDPLFAVFENETQHGAENEIEGILLSYNP